MLRRYIEAQLTLHFTQVLFVPGYYPRENIYSSMLNGLFFISGLRGLMGSANKSSSPSTDAGPGMTLPSSAALSDTGAVPMAPRWPALDLGMAEKDDTATSPPCGDSEKARALASVNVFAGCY